MGWKGKGLGKDEQGIVEPIRAGIRDPKLGVGKQEQDDFFTAEENVQCKKLDVEVEDTEEHAKKRERFKQMREMHGSSSCDDRLKQEQLRQERGMTKYAQMADAQKQQQHQEQPQSGVPATSTISKGASLSSRDQRQTLKFGFSSKSVTAKSSSGAGAGKKPKVAAKVSIFGNDSDEET